MNITIDPIIVQTVEAVFTRDIEAESSEQRFPMEQFVSRLPPTTKAQIDMGHWGARSLPEEIPQQGSIPIKDLKYWTFSIVPRTYGGAEEWSLKTLRNDQTGQASANVGSTMASLAQHFHTSLATSRLISGTTDLCYDGAALISASHNDAPSGAESNLISASAVDPTNITDAEFAAGIKEARSTIAGFKDDAGKPMNLNLNQYVIMAPQALEDHCARHFSQSGSLGGGSPRVDMGGGTIEPINVGYRWGINDYSTETDSVYLLKAATGNTLGPLIQMLDVPWHIAMFGPEDERELFHRDKVHTAYRSEQEIKAGWWRHVVKIVWS